MREIRRRTRVVGGGVGIDAGGGPATTYRRNAVGNETLPENGLAAEPRRCRALHGMNPDWRHRRTKVQKILDTIPSSWWCLSSLVVGCLATPIKPVQSHRLSKCAKNIVRYLAS